MITLSGYGDEISPDLETQLDVMQQEGIRYLDLRSVVGAYPPESNMLKLTDKELARIKKRIKERGFQVFSFNTSIGKVPITEDFTPHLKELRRAIDLAKYFGTPNIRIFSYYIPKGEMPWNYREEVLRRLKQLTQAAEREGVVLMLENDVDLYGSNGERLQDLFQSINSPHLRLAFDPANFILSQVMPMTDAYPYVERYLSWVQAKDAMVNTGKNVPIGAGDGQIRELLRELKKKNYTGVISVESRLLPEGKLSGLSPAQLFVVNVRALKKLMKEEGLEWRR